MAIVQLRHDTEGRAYYRRTLTDGKTPREALRCLIGELKRRPSDTVYKQLLTDARGIDSRSTKAVPEGHLGATVTSSAADPTLTADSSDQSLPGPTTPNATPPHALLT
jgi:transposase